MRHSVLVGCFCLLAAGCVERKEHITVSPSGGVMLQLTYTSDSEKDLYEGDAVPRIKDGWVAEQLTEHDDDDNARYIFKAQTAFAPRKPIISSYATPSDPDADLHLQFPTSLKIEKRGDGMYFHFNRTYAPRPWAMVQALQERFVDAPLQGLKGTDPKEWSPLQRESVARALAKFEIEKMLIFARAAYRIATPEAAQDGWLAASDHMRRILETLDYSVIVRMLGPREEAVDEEVVDEILNAEIKGIAEHLEGQLKVAMKERAGLDSHRYNLFMIEYDRQRKRFDITEDLGDDRFEITVEMPGVIVATNADEVNGTSAKWTFDGQLLRDREMELMVTSRMLPP